MAAFSYTRGEERAFLDTSFEPHGEGFVFYRHHWARGIEVSAAERETYLSPALDGDRGAFYRAIAGRPGTLPRRPYRRALGAMLRGFPAGFGWSFLGAGALLLWRGVTAASAWLSWLCFVAGAMAAAFGFAILAVRLPARGR